MSTTADLPDGGTSPGEGRHLSVVRSESDVLIARLGELAGHIHAAQAELVGLLAELERCGGWQGVGLRSIGHWASIELGIDARTASAQARAGLRLSTVPAIASAARAGELGWDKLKLLTRVVEPASESHWLSLAREMSVGQLRRVVSAYRRASDDGKDPDGQDRARRRRGIWLFDEPDGLVRVTALLEPDDAAVLRAALAAHLELLWRDRDHGGFGTAPGGKADPAPRRPGAAGDVPDDATHDDPGAGQSPATGPDARTERSDPGEAEPHTAASDADGTGESHVEPAAGREVDPTLAAADPLATRRVDALVSLLRAALAQPGIPDLADDATQVMLHVDHDLLTGHADVGPSHYTDGPSLPVATARRVCCDALIRPLIHRGDQPLDIGRASRTPNRAQRRALRYRDRGCTFPGCESRHWLDAHHIRHWADNGPTDLANMTLLCRHHHRLHHEGRYTITMIDGRPRFHRPDGTQIGPPPPPAPDPHRGSTTLRRQHSHDGHHIDRHTPGARSGGAPHWSPRHALDTLLN
jgi:hypothetical protein